MSSGRPPLDVITYDKCVFTFVNIVVLCIAARNRECGGLCGEVWGPRQCWVRGRCHGTCGGVLAIVSSMVGLLFSIRAAILWVYVRGFQLFEECRESLGDIFLSSEGKCASILSAEGKCSSIFYELNKGSYAFGGCLKNALLMLSSYILLIIFEHILTLQGRPGPPRLFTPTLDQMQNL